MTTCRVCPAEILWIETEGGRRVPLDAEPSPRGNYLLLGDGKARLVTSEVERRALWKAKTRLYLDHHATCRNVARVRAGELQGQASLF